MTAKEIEAEITKLPKRARLRLVRKILDGMESANEREVAQAWLEEVRRREKDLAEGRDEEISYEQAMSEVRAALRR
ncbi:MAG TPA: addiction module protein [Candidatus Binataceae bacterium]|nr:addiction module protein [Candidatus Binataceae bacterium]